MNTARRIRKTVQLFDVKTKRVQCECPKLKINFFFLVKNLTLKPLPLKVILVQ